MSLPSEKQVLTPEQQEVVQDNSSVLAVAASAGSGKTFALTERVVQRALIASSRADLSPSAGLDISRILVVTFTRSAANSLRERLVSRLNQELHEVNLTLADPGADHLAAKLRLQQLRRQLAGLPMAQISTIHSFCQELLRRFGHTIGYRLGRVMDEQEVKQLKHELASEYLDRALGEEASALLRELALAWGGIDGVGADDLSQIEHETGLRGIVLGLAEFRSALVDPQRWFQEHLPSRPLDESQFDATHPIVISLVTDLASWSATWLARIEEERAEFSSGAPGADHIQYLDRRSELLRDATAIQGWEQLRHVFDLLTTRHDGREGRPKLPHALAPSSSWTASIADQRLKELAQASTAEFRIEVAQWADLVNCDWTVWARRENKILGWVGCLWSLVDGFEKVFADFKTEHELADFNDLERKAMEVLVEKPEVHGRPEHLPGLACSDVALELAEYYQAVLVDEYQDVNPLQHEILRLVASGASPGPTQGRSLFAVGDTKQSIYGFRQADPSIFIDLQDSLRFGTTPTAGRVLPLRVNFRSKPAVLEAVNFVFRGLMTRGFGGEDYCEENELRPPPSTAPDQMAKTGVDCAPGASLHLVLSDQLQDENGEEEDAEDLSRDDTVYHRVGQVLRHHYTVGHYAWRDMVVLVRSATSQLDPLRRILIDQGIPTYAASRTGFYERPEVADALPLLAVIDNPRQDISLAAVLRGPVVGLSPAELLEAARPRGLARPAPGTLWQRIQAFLESDTVATQLTERLRRFASQVVWWRDQARSLPLADLMWRLYTEAGLLAAAGALSDGKQRVANLIALHDMARAASTRGFSLARYLAYVRNSREARGDTGEPSVLSEADDVVQILTVHQAKGLESPVVVLAYLHRNFNLDSSKGNVLWHRNLGISGVLIDLAEGLSPSSGTEASALAKLAYRSHPTYLYQKIKREAQRDCKAEELRLLYVALTRARERLDVVVPATQEEITQGKVIRQPEDARCPWDWLKSRLRSSLEKIDFSRDAADLASGALTESGWIVCISRASEKTGEMLETARTEKNGKPDSPVDGPEVGLTAQDLEVIKARLSFKYSFPGSTRLPYKAVVTQVSASPQHFVSQEEDSYSVVDLAGQSMGELEIVASDRESGVAAIELGTLVHRLLAVIDIAQLPGVEQLSSVLNILDAPEQLKSEVPIAKLARVVRMIHEAYDGFHDAQLRREYPITLLVAPDDVPLLHHEYLGEYHPTDQILIQGVIDLLAVWQDRAIVLDYKMSNASAEHLRQRYQLQLRWYADAVRALFPQIRPDKVISVICGVGSETLVTL